VEGLGVRFTAKGDALYAIVLGQPEGERVVIRDLDMAGRSSVRMLGYEGDLSWEQDGADLSVALPPEVAATCAVAFRIAEG
jgi:alpha-L-fucosidase